MISHGYPKIAAAGLSLGIRGQPEGRGPAGRTITVSPRQPRPEAVFAAAAVTVSLQCSGSSSCHWYSSPGAGAAAVMTRHDVNQADAAAAARDSDGDSLGDFRRRCRPRAARSGLEFRVSIMKFNKRLSCVTWT